MFSSRRCRVKPPPRRRSFSCPFVPALHRPAASLPRHLPKRAELGARRRRGRGAPGAAGPPRRGAPRRTRKSLPVLRREKGSRCFISPEKLLQRHTGAQTNQSDSGNGPSPANLGAPGGRKAPVAWRAGRSCGGDADGLLPRRSAASAPLQRGQSGRTAPHPPPAAGTCRRLTPAPGAGRDLHYGRRTFAVRGRPQTGPS